MKNFKLIKSLAKKEVVETWRAIEEPLEHWQAFWKAKKHKSWQEWRETTHKTVLDRKLNWNLYRVNNPISEVPQWRGGMFHSWCKWFYPVMAERPPRLKDLLAHPGVNNHWYVRTIAENFISPTTVTAIRLPNGDISVVEGMHRCCALAYMAHNKTKFKGKLLVILADWPNAKPPKLGHWEEKK